MNSKRTVFFLIFLLQLHCGLCLVVKVKNGYLEGTSMRLRNGETFDAFLKIPFAEPPTGELRFRAPLPKSSWLGVLNCTTFGPMCMQQNSWGRDMSEDCLHLNVFTKNAEGGTDLKPVIFFIHGGGFEAGSSIEHGPDYLMEREIVLVTVNYRLGIFGFLAIESAEISGNQGLKDQVLALEWVQNNIESFGGDPNQVTVAGLSAGAYSATALVISPMAQGLFKNVIAMSGALAWQKKLKTNNIQITRELAEKINCSIASVEEMTDCLKAKPAEELSKMVNSFFECPIMTWLPVVEPDLAQERFLVEEPNDSLREGRFAKVNVMIGITENEFASPVAAILGNSSLTNLLNENFNQIAPSCFFFEENDLMNSEQIAEALRSFYLPYPSIDIRSFNSLNNLFADGVIGYGVHRFVHFVSNFTDVYYYKFSFIGRYSIFKYPRNSPYGVHHADDIQYLFSSAYVSPLIEYDDPESIAVERMTGIWEQFAWTGNPNNSTEESLEDMNWVKHDLSTEDYLEIGTNLVEKHGLFLERYAVWDRLEASSCNSVRVSSMIALILLVKHLSECL